MYLIYFFFDSVQLYILVYVRYMSSDVFPMYFSCIRSLHYLKDISDNLDTSQLYVGGYTIFFPRATPNNMFASSTFVYTVTV